MAQAAGFNSSSEHPAEKAFRKVQPAVPEDQKNAWNSHRLMRPMDNQPWREEAKAYQNSDGSISINIPEGRMLVGRLVLQPNRDYMGDEKRDALRAERALQKLQEAGNNPA
mgnify:CR=1 FL=1